MTHTFTRRPIILLSSFLLMNFCCVNGKIVPCPHWEYDKDIYIPYEESEDFLNNCAPSCVIMWCYYDGIIADAPSQLEVIDYMGGVPTTAYDTERAVNWYTNSQAILDAVAPNSNPENLEQEKAVVNAARYSLDSNMPSIFTLEEGIHAVILCGAYGNIVNEAIEVEAFQFKDPNFPLSENNPSEYDYDTFFAYWSPSSYSNRRECVRGFTRSGSVGLEQADLMDELKNFYRYNGTYYGGPASYIPVGSEFVRISYPIGSNELTLMQQKNIEWESNGKTGNIKLELLKGDSYLGTIATNLPISQSSYSWNVGQYQGGTATVGDDYKIKITMMDGSDYDTSNVDFSITPQLPDVVTTNITMVPASPTAGENVTIKATIKNQGLAATPNGIDVGTAFKVDGAYIGAFFVKDANGNHKALAAGESYQGTCNAQWTATVGTHTLWAMGDDVNRFPESNENNNVMEKSFIVSNALPDVVITSISLVPATPTPGQKVTVKATIKNQGTAATPTGVYVGVGFTIDSTYLGAFFVMNGSNFSSLGVNESYTAACGTQWTATAGAHNVWVTADDANRFPESNENNNRGGKSFTVVNALPDVIITSITLSPAAPTPGQKVTFMATIKNQGNAPTPSGVYVGVGFTIDSTYLGAFFVMNGSNFSSLGVNESYTAACGTQWTATAGAHNVWVTADDANRFPESNENNNRGGKSINVQ